MHSFLFVLFVILTLALFSAAVPRWNHYNVHEKRTRLPSDWTLTRRLDATLTIPLRFALKQGNIEHIGSYLHDVSHPKSTSYGKHWAPADIARTFTPTDEAVDVVSSWLVASGIGEDRIALGRTRGWIQVGVSVKDAEQLLDAEYNVYTHVSGKEHVACEVYHLPTHVQPHVDFVTPSVNFDAKLTRRSAPIPNNGYQDTVFTPKIAGAVLGTVGKLEQCDEYITPICLRTLYGFFYRPVATEKNSYAVVEYTPQAYLYSDLQDFAQKFSTDLVGKSPHLVSIDGGFLQTIDRVFSYNAESALDLQYGMTMVTGEQTTTLYQAGDAVESASFNNFLDAIDGSYCTFEGGDDPSQDSVYPDPLPSGYKGREDCGTAKPAYVISTSYGYSEADLTPFYARRQCAEYAKLGLMGVTVLFSSGDYGVAGDDGLCLNPDGTQTPSGRIFSPTFPGTCPYVTSVGATMVKPNATVFDREAACTQEIYSGGGFSNYFAIPDYQRDAVGHYLKNSYPDYPSDVWNSTGTSRAFPDVSANGANYVTAVDGRFRRLFGTSASSPVVGAIFAMVNDARLSCGKSSIGFVNPAIYSPEFAGAFNDITEGNNPGCNTTGFNATIGWDPVTGLGTPNFPKLLELWLSLP